MIPKANQIYKHFKGNLYRVITIAKHSETEEEMVVYQALYGDYAVYTRPFTSFVEVLDRAKYPQARQKHRFEPVEELIEPVVLEETIHASAEVNEQQMCAEASVVVKEEKPERKESVAIKEEKKEPIAEHKEEGSISCQEETVSIDPMLEAYLDADSYREKLNILHGLRHRITEHMLLTMAVVIDFELPEGSMEEKYDALNDCLMTRERYECNRMG